MTLGRLKLSVLHLSNDFLGSTVYRELYDKLAKIDAIQQTVYYPLRKSTVGKNVLLKKKKLNYTIIPSALTKSYHRLFFKAKINFLYADTIKKIDFRQIDCIHATTLFSDGAVAYRLYKSYGIPYIVTIRNTDLNLFFKYMFHLRSLGLEILRNARQIIFISPLYLERFVTLPYIHKYYDNEFKNKVSVIPNGINDFWVKNWEKRKESCSVPIQLLYIGKFSEGKNVKRLVQSVQELNSKEPNKYILNIVGGGGDNGKTVQLINRSKFIVFHGKIYDKGKLKALMRDCDIFTMPSKRETFGLVYIEALSQGLPIVYTHNEGIDGFYSGIGEAVNPHEIESIKRGIQKISESYSKYKFEPADIVQNHSWSQIADQYLKIYCDLN